MLKFSVADVRDERQMFNVKMYFRDKFSDKTIELEIPAVNFDSASAEVERLISFLDIAVARYPHGKGGLDDFRDIPDYYRYFGEEEEGAEFYDSFGTDPIWWPAHEGEYPMNIEKYEIVYTDRTNSKFNVTS